MRCMVLDNSNSNSNSNSVVLRISSSSSSGLVDHRPEGSYHDQEIEPGGAVVEVEQVVAELDAGVAEVAAVDLGQAGDAGADAVALLVAGDLALELFDEAGALGARADDAHLAAQDVDELRDLVQARLAQQAADGGQAAVVVAAAQGGTIALGVDHHRAQL